MTSKQRRWFDGQFKNGKKSSVVVTIICLVIFIAGFGAGSILTMYPDSAIGRWQNYGDPITFIISFVALVFAMITYFSIDAVEKKNKMDNNILETENYTVAYNRVLKELGAETEDEYNVLQILEDCVRTRKNICYMFEKSNSFLAGKFADELDRAAKLQKSFVKNKR